MAATTTTMKRCVACGKDVSQGKRMKDSQGRYWCVDCGAADQRKKASVGGGVACSACGKSVGAGQISKWGNAMLCAACVKQRQKGPSLMERLRGGGGGKSSRSSDGNSGRGRLIGMISFMGLLAVIFVYMHFFSGS
jgi:DNA-directed RNA polymerase subunit RPC12/RpoP